MVKCDVTLPWGLTRRLVYLSQFQTEWEDTDLGATPRSNRKLLVDLDESGSLGGKVNEVYEPDDLDNNDFDDLIFALKTRGQYEPTQDQRDGDLPPDDSDEHFEMRRISIADTHLWRHQSRDQHFESRIISSADTHLWRHRPRDEHFEMRRISIGDTHVSRHQSRDLAREQTNQP